MEFSWILYWCILSQAVFSAKAQNFETSNDLLKERIQEGKQRLEEFQTTAQYSPCWKEALDNLHSTCRTMSDDDQRRLALAFSNCHFKASNRETYPCPPESDVGDCTSPSKMDSSAFNVYTEFFTHSNSICFYLQSALWQEKTEKTVDKLSDTSKAAVEKLEKSLEYHKELELKQDKSLKNQDSMLSYHHQLSESVQNTKTDMDKAFQEMYAKAESQKMILDDVLGTLRSGFGNIQWLMSSILGEIITIETAGFFIVSLLLITLLPQFGTSRLWLYLTLILYGLFEGLSRNMFFAIVDPKQPDAMSSLHSFLWYSRWIAFLVFATVFYWRYLMFNARERKQDNLLSDMNQQLRYIKQSLHARAEEADIHVAHCSDSENSYIAEDECDSLPTAGLDSTDDNSTPYTIPVEQLYQEQNKGQRIVSGTQLIDFLSGIYIRGNAHSLNNNEIYTTSQTDDTFRPISLAVSTVTDSGSLEDHDDRFSESDTASLIRSPLAARSELTQQTADPQEFQLPYSNSNESIVSTHSSLSLTLERCSLPKTRRTTELSTASPAPLSTDTINSERSNLSDRTHRLKSVRESTPISHQRKKKRRAMQSFRAEVDDDSGFSTDGTAGRRGRYYLRPRSARQQTPVFD